jgi:hypothetical protein
MSDPTDPTSPLDGGGPLDVAETPAVEAAAARRKRMTSIFGAVGAAILIIAALVWLLGDDDADDDVVVGGTTTAVEETATVAETATTEVNPTSTMEEATTTESPATATTTVRLPAEPPLRTDAVSGSGCTPGRPGALPDGWWYGTIDPPLGSTMAFDLACYYLGGAAEEEAAKRGDEVDNDYYVVNERTEVRSVPLASDATVSCVSLGNGVTSGDCAPGDVAGDWAVWIRVQGGAIDRIVEQYAP